MWAVLAMGGRVKGMTKGYVRTSFYVMAHLIATPYLGIARDVSRGGF